MSFSFGSTSQPTFGSAAAKPTGFGTPFGSTPTTQSAAFGGFGSTFGSTSQQTPAFGATAQQTPAFGSSFGTSTGTTPAFGSTFGAGTSSTPAFGAAGSSAPAFGAGTSSTAAFGSAPVFGATASSAPAFGAAGGSAPAFGAGASSAPAFGAPASSAPGFGSIFGTPAASSAPTFGTGFGSTGSSLFGTSTTKPSLFGTPATTSSLFSTPATSAPSLFGTATSQAPSLFGNISTSTTPSLFGTTATTAPSLFGSTFGGTTTTAAPSLFGATNTSTPGFGLFGSTATTSAPSLFGGFGTTQPTQNAFGGFGTGTTAIGAPGFSRPSTSASIEETAARIQHQVLTSIYAISIFNDERDDILKKWNMLQACWGTGKGYFRPNEPPVEYTPHNPFYRFKAVAYNVIPEHDNAEGLVKLIFNRPYSQLSTQKEVIANGIAGILGNKPNLKVNVQHVKVLTDSQAEIRITVTEKGVTGASRNVLATDLAAFLNQPAQKQQLTNVGVTSIVPFVTPSKAALEEYLNTVPLGFDPQMWKAAIADNPNPDKFMPVPIYGFNDLKARKIKQDHETGLHRAFHEKITNDLDELKKKQASSMAKVNELKHRFLHLQHRTLRILVRQESIRKSGLAIDPREEILKGKLEYVFSQLNIPTQFKGQLNELISTVRVLEKTRRPAQPRYTIVAEGYADLKDVLQRTTQGIAALVKIVKDDMNALKIIMECLQQLIQNKHSIM